MDLTTLERLPLWIGGRAVSALTKRYGEVTNPQRRNHRAYWSHRKRRQEGG